MNLKRQLLLVSVLTLILPWAGCQFVRETESALREGQQQMLAGTAQAIADSLSQFPEELLTDHDPDRPGANQLYAQPLLNPPLLDGYFDDWTIEDSSTQSLRGTDGDIRYVLGIHRQNLYLYVDVRDSSLVYVRPTEEGRATYADEVAIVSENTFGAQTVYRFRAEAPGHIVATIDAADGDISETRIDAEWQDTATGYRLEARLPRSLAGEKLGLFVTNVSDFRNPGIRSATFVGPSPGHFVTVSPLLQSVAAGYAQDGIRLIITDMMGWRKALAGTLFATDEDEQPQTPSGWMRRVYDLVLDSGNESVLLDPDPSGREQLSYVSEALQGRPASRWFRSAETGRAVISVAYPIWSGTVQTGAIILQQGTDAILSLTNQALTRLLTLTLTATIAVALVLLGYASWLSARIRQLSGAADRALDEKRVRTALPSALAGDEIGDLSRSFSSVLQQLGTYNDYLQTLAGKLSHELRTPLTIVRSSLENLEHENLSGDAVTYTARAKEGVERLGKILNAMSEASRTEELIEHVEPELFDIGNVLQSAVAAYDDAWPEREFILESSCRAEQVFGSPELVIQMLDKLVDNAVDFSADGDQITVRAMRDENEIVLKVSNPGPPLPEDMQTQIYRSMVSVRKDDSGKHLGLGLHIAWLIAEGHKGSISATNDDAGVTFEVRLPAA